MGQGRETMNCIAIDTQQCETLMDKASGWTYKVLRSPQFGITDKQFGVPVKQQMRIAMFDV